MSIKTASEIVHFAGHTPRPPAPAAVPICSTQLVWYRVQTGAACPASGRVCWCAVSCMVCLASGTACPAACAAQSFRVRWGLGSPPAGYTAAAQPRPVSSAKNLQNKKGVLSLPTPSFLRKTPYPPLPISKISRKNKKTPTKGLYSVLYLPCKP